MSTGDLRAQRDFYTLAYGGLRRLATRLVTRKPSGEDLQATALVHEAWIKLAVARKRRWRHPQHFMAAFERVMRSVLVDHVRAQRTLKRGGGAERLTLDSARPEARESGSAVHRAFVLRDAIDSLDDRGSVRRIARMRLCEGLSHREIADSLGVTVRTVERACQRVRVELRRALEAA